MTTVRALVWMVYALVADFGLSQTPEDTATEPAVEPAQALSTFRVADGLRWTRVLSEPTIAQPLQSVFDSHGRLWVVEYRQYPYPEGLKPLSRDKHWRIVYDSIPQPPGRGGLRGQDRISVHEDRDGDGDFEIHGVFVDGLNIATAVAPDADGAWVLNPPYLLYYRDADHDLRADGDPEIHLAGFGLEDTHSVVNSLCFGPDGWLYAAQGSTVSASIKPFGSSAAPITSMGQALWRYHPVTREYEIFAEGGGNAFGVAFNDRGEVFSGHNGGDTRGFHYYPGGYYRKGFSKHGDLSNPHSYGYLNPMVHDPIPRFTHTMLFTESTALAALTPQSMLAIDPLHGKLIQTRLEKTGSTYATKDIADTVSSSDKWFRPVAISDGPDGAAYVCDWYDSVVAHIYAFEGKLDRDRGRVYRLSADAPARVPPWDSELAHRKDTASLAYLYVTMKHPYRWQRWQARELLSHHPDRESLRDRLAKDLFDARDPSSPVALELLWTAHALSWIPDTIPFSIPESGGSRSTADASNEPWHVARLLQHPHPMVRAWTVRLVCDDRSASSESVSAIAAWARAEKDPSVLCQIVCSAKRLPAGDAMAILRATTMNASFGDDPFLPLLTWWALERHAADRDTILEFLIREKGTWESAIARRILYPNLVRRWSSMGTDASYQGVAEVFQQIASLPEAPRNDAGKAAQDAFEQAFVGRSLAGVPDAIIDAMVRLGQPSLTLLVRRGDNEALSQAVATLRDSKSPDATRAQLARLAGELAHVRKHPGMLDALVQMAKDNGSKTMVRGAALSALSGYDDMRVGAEILEMWAELPQELRPVAGAVLASRASWTSQWLNNCSNNQSVADQMPPESVRAMRLHPDEALQAQIAKLYPAFASIDLAAANARSREIAGWILDGSGDPYQGKKWYRELCSRCHRLFDDGGAVGPELTGYQRDQLETLLRNIIAPSLEIREGYQMVRVMTDDASVLSGFIESQTDDQLLLRNIDGQLHTLERESIESLQPQVLSLMPEGLLDKLEPTQLRDLMAYLRSSQPLNDGS
ncbi:MAG: PVC-type heme-binding CxxCH protein [Planctomycetota bacterium]